MGRVLPLDKLMKNKGCWVRYTCIIQAGNYSASFYADSLREIEERIKFVIKRCLSSCFEIQKIENTKSYGESK